MKTRIVSIAAIAAIVALSSASVALADSAPAKSKKPQTTKVVYATDRKAFVAALTTIPNTSTQKRRDFEGYEKIVSTWSPARQAEEREGMKELLALEAAQKKQRGN